ncbi:protein kinase [Actinoallomurus sp. NPDC052308]|uniref:WD40 repeat domain-containing serine/threonine protein kinase n=1 Tax=Actinoallomurus sp. NPDC052308 TaxID=3155530 RepID=UPI003423E10B
MVPLDAADPRQVGPYRLEGRLGGGGMGQVFLGRSPGGRPVAVKVVRPELAGDVRFRERFAVEVEAARRVGGFYTAQVVDADVRADPPWLVTAYVPGPSLHEAVRSHGPLPATAVAVLGAGLAEGLVAIHGCGLVHRDLKPANVILADDGPRVIDFGIARALDATHHTTSILGTPAFMSPEQGRGDPLGPESDVFSLGSVLAFAATGDSPFGTGAAHAVVYRVVHDRPDLTGLAGLPARLADLITECLAKDPADRPTLAAILDRLGTAPDLLGRWLPSAVTTMVAEREAVPGGASPGLDGSGTSPTRSTTPARTPEGEDGMGPEERTGAAPKARELLAAGPPGAFAVAAGPGSAPPGEMRQAVPGQAVPGQAVTRGDQAPPGPGRARPRPTRRARTVLAAAAAALALVVGTVVALSLSSPPARGRAKARATTPVNTPVPTLSPATLMAKGASVDFTVFSPDGKALASASRRERVIRLWDVPTGELRTTLTAPGNVFALAFGSGGTTLAAATDARGGYAIRIQLWSLFNDKLVDTLPRSGLLGAYITLPALLFSPDGSTLASATNDAHAKDIYQDIVQLWDTTSGRVTASFSLPAHILSMAFSPDGRTLATSDNNSGAPGTRVIRLWDVTSGRANGVINTGSDGGPCDQGVRSLSFSADGKTLAGGCDGTAAKNGVRLWDVTTRQVITPSPGYGGDWVAFSTNGATLASLQCPVAGDGCGGTLHVWISDATHRYATRENDLAPQPGAVQAQAFSPDAMTLAIGYDNGALRLWKLR